MDALLTALPKSMSPDPSEAPTPPAAARPAPADAGFLVLDGLNKFFGSNHVIRDLSLTVRAGEILALLGPSGSGKTTILRLLAGFERPELGAIWVAGEPVHELPPARRGFGMVFQSYALFPHMTVAENVAFGLLTRGLSREEIERRVTELLELVELQGFEARRIGEISGGQQQRVALARALAPRPRILMLDEPLSNLDPSLRERTRRLLRQAVKDTGITTVLVTHEQEEAFELGDRVGVLAAGRLDQVATPEELYERPATRFVASFVGRMSLLQGILEEVRGELARVRVLGGQSAAGVADWWAAASAELGPGDAVDLAVRPEGLRFAGSEDEGSLSGRVLERRFTGPATYYAVELDLGCRVELLGNARAAWPGDRVHVVPRLRPLPRIFVRERAEER